MDYQVLLVEGRGYHRGLGEADVLRLMFGVWCSYTAAFFL